MHDRLWLASVSGSGLVGPSRLFEAGARLQAFVDTDADDDKLQASLYPYLGLRDRNWFVNGGVLMNLDEPLGFAFDEGKIWGLRLRAGARF